MNPRILYEDNHILAAEKPCNMPSQEDQSKDPDFLSALKGYIKEKYQKPGSVYLGLLHRLDRPAGGAMVFARTSKAAARMSEAFRTGGVEKSYYAVLQSPPPEKKGELIGYMVKDEKTNLSRMAGESEPGAKGARLAYETVDIKDGLTLVRIRLFTGRSHQIRVQFSSAGCPLYGDVRYGNEKQKQLALWSHEIRFKHPVREETITVTSDPPDVYPWNLFF